MQVHYNRVAEDGISSHKEITVMFLPNLSDSIPILEVGQAQSMEQQQAKLENDIADKNEKVCTIKEASLFHDQLWRGKSKVTMLSLSLRHVLSVSYATKSIFLSGPEGHASFWVWVCCH